jgi:preprotein translocase subunit Sss1
MPARMDLLSSAFYANRTAEFAMCTRKPSWSIFDSLLLGALAPFVLLGVIGLVGALFF